MGINSASDDPDEMCEEMLQFEREHGSLDTFEIVPEKCSAQLKRVRDRREKVSYCKNAYVHVQMYHITRSFCPGEIISIFAPCSYLIT